MLKETLESLKNEKENVIKSNYNKNKERLRKDKDDLTKHLAQSQEGSKHNDGEKNTLEHELKIIRDKLALDVQKLKETRECE